MKAIENQNTSEKLPYIEISSGIMRGYQYNKQSKTLYISDNGGFIYQYFEVPETVIDDMLNSKEPDEFYKKNIRKRFRRLFKTFNLSLL